MKLSIKLLVSLGICTALSLGITIINPLPRLLIDRIAALAAMESAKSINALEILEQVSLGRMDDIDPGMLVKIGVDPGPPQPVSAFRDHSIRVYALKKIGEIELDDALKFLTNLQKVDIGPDTTGMIWPATQYALANVRLNRISDPQLKITFLENIVIDRAPASSWAANQLCDRGSLVSGFVTRKYLKSLNRDPYGEEQAQFCEARMQIVARNPDRAKALGSVLSVENVVKEKRLTTWAIYQLADMCTPSADAELTRFNSELKSMTKEDPWRYSYLTQSIDAHLLRNDQKRSAQNPPKTNGSKVSGR